MKIAGREQTFWEKAGDILNDPLYNIEQIFNGGNERVMVSKLKLAERLHPGYGYTSGTSAREVLEANGYDWETGKKISTVFVKGAVMQHE